MSQSSEEVYIPERFEKAVTLHLLKNKLADGKNINPPLILGIDGLPGTGKTFQCKKVIEKLDFHGVSIAGSELESKEAGEPAMLIEERYIDANFTLDRRAAKGAAIIMDDLDVFIGDWGSGTQYTVNRQFIFGALMALADNPYMVGGQKTRRIPIIITGNDFTKLYEPLTRPGRFERFTWIPGKEEIIAVASSILNFADKGVVRRLVLALIDLYQKNDSKVIPISFFSHLKTMLIDDIIWDYYQNNPVLDDRANDKFKVHFNNFFETANLQEELLNKASILSQRTTFDVHFRGNVR